jgi:adenylate kinase family enzyme
MDRVVVVGTSCSGKTTTARALAQALGSPHVELDSLYWQPGWTETPEGEFRLKVASAIESERWVVDGNYSAVRDLVWPRATHIIWLNYSYLRVLWRAFSRTLRRSVTGEVMWAGNRESIRKAFFSSDSIIWWAATTYHRRRRRYRRLFDEEAYPRLQMHELQSQRETDAFIAELGSLLGPGADRLAVR